MENFEQNRKKSWDPTLINKPDGGIKPFNREASILVQKMMKEKLVFEKVSQKMKLPVTLQIGIHNQDKLLAQITEVQEKIRQIEKNIRSSDEESSEYPILKEKLFDLEAKFKTECDIVNQILAENKDIADLYYEYTDKTKEIENDRLNNPRNPRDN